MAKRPRKRSSKRPPAKRERVVDLLDLPVRKATPAEQLQKQKALEAWLKDALEPHRPALEQIGQALKALKTRGSQGDPFGFDRMRELNRPLALALPALSKPRGNVERPRQGKPAGADKVAPAKRRAKARPDRARARWAIQQLYPRGVPDTVSPKILHREVANKLLEHETAKLNLPAPSLRTVQRARDSL